MLDEKLRNYIILVISILITFGIGFYFGNNNKANSLNLTESGLFLNEENTSKIKVFVSGEIRNSGVYELEKGNRVIDLIEKAGGIKESGDIQSINPARVLKDGESITIESKTPISISNETDKMVIADRSFQSNKININKASLEDLKKLSGIGDVKGQAIIDYREENGPFTDIEELKEVSGIGEKTFEKIRDQISIR